MKTRLQYIVKNEGLTNQKFAAEIGISPAAVTHIISGRNNPSLEIIAKIASRYPKYALRWLILGELPILVTDRKYEAPTSLHEAATENNTLLNLPFEGSITSATRSNTTDKANEESNTAPQENALDAQCNNIVANPDSKPTQQCDTHTSCDRLIVCFPDGTFKEFSRQQ